MHKSTIHFYSSISIKFAYSALFTEVSYDASENSFEIHSWKKSVCNYFDSLISQSSSSTMRTSKRSAMALARRNQRKHEKLDKKQKLFQIQRKVTTPWTLKHVKEFLKQKEIVFAKLPPKQKNVLRIRFNNSISLEEANKTLSEDIFSEETFFKSFSL